MDYKKIGEAIMIVFDELQNDERSSNIVELIDGGENDSEIKDGLEKGIIRLKELGKNDIAKKVQSLMEGI